MTDSIFNKLNDWKDSAKEYTDLQIKYFKLQMVENLSKLFTGLITKIVLFILLLFFVLFLGLSLSYYLGGVLNSNALGFLFGGLCYIIVAVIFLITKRKLVDKPVIQAFIKMFFPEKLKSNTDE